MNIKKLAKAIIKKLNNDLSPENIISYLNSLGCTVAFTSTKEGKVLLTGLELDEPMSKYNALTYYNNSIKIVFVDDTIAKQDMLCSLLHEMAHIVLGHMEGHPSTRDKRQNEMEAEALVYLILNHK